MKIFVTGGTGNIGQYVTLALLKAGHELVLLTRTPDRIPAFSTLPGVTLVKGSVLETAVMRNAMQGCEAVVHIALGWGNDPVEMLEHDTRVTACLMQTAEEFGMKNFVYTSSTAAMGDLRDGMDETAVLLPGDLYGATKASTEMYLLGFNQYYSGQGVYGKKVALRRNIIRPGYTFSTPAFEGGASQSDTRFQKIALGILKNETLTFDPLDGTQFLSAQQIAQLYVKLVESDLNREVFLALGARFISWAEIARMTKSLVPESHAVIACAEPEGKPKMYGVGKMERVFGLRFDGGDDLMEHLAWNVERARKILAGETVHNPYHVW